MLLPHTAAGHCGSWAHSASCLLWGSMRHATAVDNCRAQLKVRTQPGKAGCNGNRIFLQYGRTAAMQESSVQGLIAGSIAGRFRHMMCN